MSIRSLLPDSTKLQIRRGLGRLGIEIGSYTGSLAEHRATLLGRGHVSTVWDVGAHIGQYGARLRSQGYRRQIVSIEPSEDAVWRLRRLARNDRHWTVVDVAVSDVAGQGTLHVSANGQSSSLLPMAARHVAASPDSVCIGTQPVTVTTLDTLHARLDPPKPFFIKLDLQGGELRALRGASKLMEHTVACEVELSLAELYRGGPTWEEVAAYMRRYGWTLCDLERVFFDPHSNDLLQINALFRR